MVGSEAGRLTLDDEDLEAIADALAPLIAEALAGSGSGVPPDTPDGCRANVSRRPVW